MGKTIVIYKSKYGTTKAYAEWIANELKADLFEVKQINWNKLMEYDTIIFGGGLYAGGIIGSSIISDNFQQIKDKNIVVFTVGLSATENLEIFKPLIDKNFTTEMKSKIKFFHFRGGIDYSKLNFIHKRMMGMLKFAASKKSIEELTEDDKLFLETYGSKINFTNFDTAIPLKEYILSTDT